MPSAKSGIGTIICFDYRINMIKELNFFANKLIVGESENQIRKTFSNIHQKYFVNLVLETFR